MITDPAEAADAALEAVERGDTDLLLDLMLAAPMLARDPFLTPYLSGSVALLRGEPDTAARFMTLAAGHTSSAGDTDTATAAVGRLRRLARKRPDLTDSVDRLAALLLPADDRTVDHTQ